MNRARGCGANLVEGRSDGLCGEQGGWVEGHPYAREGARLDSKGARAGFAKTETI
jgi:hypothetical protein